MIFLLLLAAVSAAAGETVVLSMEDAVERALRNHPDVQVMQASVGVASAEMAGARVLPAPEFRMSFSNFDLDPDTLDERNTVAMRYTPPRLREFRFRQEGVRARQRSAEAELRATRARIAAAVRYAYRRAVLAEERVNLARRALDLRRGIRSTVFRQVSAGLKEADERDLADLTVDEAESELRRAAMLAEADRRKLARLVDPSGSMGFSLAVDPALLAVAALPERAVLVERAVQSRAELDAMDGACREYAAAGKLAGDQRYPWFSFVEVTHRITAIPDRGAWGFKFGVDLPLFRSRASAEARVAAARHARCELQKQALRTQIRNEVEESAGTLEELQRELAELDRLRSGPGERALERTRTALALGRAEKVDVLNAEVRVLGLRDRWLERRMQYAEIEAKLETALGVPLAGI